MIICICSTNKPYLSLPLLGRYGIAIVSPLVAHISRADEDRKAVAPKKVAAFSAFKRGNL